MNNEPVAWMSTSGNNFVSKKAPSYVKVGTNDWIPLYTNPAKTLTDEEFISVYTTWCLTSNDPLVLKQAILRKAQEK